MNNASINGIVLGGKLMNRKELGKIGENLALNFLTQKGYSRIDSNWRCRQGEVDIIMISPDKILTFIEVKLRSSHHKGNGLEAVTYHKQEQLNRLAMLYLLKHPKYNQYPIRIDVISIDYDKGKQQMKEITHIEGI